MNLFFFKFRRHSRDISNVIINGSPTCIQKFIILFGGINWFSFRTSWNVILSILSIDYSKLLVPRTFWNVTRFWRNGSYVYILQILFNFFFLFNHKITDCHNQKVIITSIKLNWYLYNNFVTAYLNREFQINTIYKYNFPNRRKKEGGGWRKRKATNRKEFVLSDWSIILFLFSLRYNNRIERWQWGT